MTTLEIFPTASYTKAAKEVLLREWALVLGEVGREVFDRALSEQIRESRFFPSIAELRERAGMRQVDRDAAEAIEQWQLIRSFINRNYYEDLGGLKHQDLIPARTAYAMRVVGGARAIYFMGLDTEPFKRKEFVEAYRLAPAHERMKVSRLADVIGTKVLAAERKGDQNPAPAGVGVENP